VFRYGLTPVKATSRYPLLTLALGLVVLAFAALGAATATASGPKGELTASEYQHLRAYLAGTQKAYEAVPPSWSAARTACLDLGTSTDLLRSTRGQCSAQLADQQAWLDLHSQKCSGTVLAQLICMAPDFQKLAEVVPRLYTADRQLREVGLARGFTGNCLISLVATKQQLSTERVYIDAAKRVAEDVAALVKAAKTRTPGSTVMTRVENDEAALDAARDNWLGAAIAYPLSVCPRP
jgi:hypothetical protein